MLAENLPAYQLEMIPEQVRDINDTLARLAALALIEADDIPRIVELARRGPRFKPVTLRFRMTDDQISDFAIQRHRFPRVDFQPRLVRHYPHGAFAAHVIGYVGAISTVDLGRLEAADYAGTAHTGKTGIEYSQEAILHGDTGHRQIVTNARGRQIPADSREMSLALPETETPQPGDNLYLSIDLDLHRVATEALDGQRGSVVAMDPRNGEFLCTASACPHSIRTRSRSA
ncbi:MAG: hypothetical protein U5K38_14670 [Woeseiaceae bacterium]|nr:hypothetical protein [Woeseiaceae bacterium]